MLCGTGALALLLAPTPSAGKSGKLIASPGFKTPEHVLVPARPSGAPTLSFELTGKLTLRCFTSAWSDGRKIKCPKAARQACADGRQVNVYAPYAELLRQSVKTESGGRFSATIVFQGDYQEVHLSIAKRRVQRGGRSISCYPGSIWVDISEAYPQ